MTANDLYEIKTRITEEGKFVIGEERLFEDNEFVIPEGGVVLFYDITIPLTKKQFVFVLDIVSKHPTNWWEHISSELLVQEAGF